ncbi:sensor histidine kinase [Erwinia psidii]|uniref:sensor histidine kinase n=1 Tax=Erwinia psidii TaxID=69224 RepID=UPI00226B93BF|nr:HAMP domain-containing sensor histidine kinase [Erwinia psidii]MCX8967028.1 sensor histidine kinase [Erwinia psidii]
MKKTVLFFAVLLSMFITSAYLTIYGFNEIKKQFDVIEPNLDNYSAAEVLFLSFERMRSAVLADGVNDKFALKKKIFDSKIYILEIKSDFSKSFFFDEQFISQLKKLKSQSVELNNIYNQSISVIQKKQQILFQLNQMESLLINLQETIYRIQIKNFSQTKNIIRDNSSNTEYLALFCLALVFIVIVVLHTNINRLRKALVEKNIFISSIYHELSTSTQAIIMATDIILHDSSRHNVLLMNEKISFHSEKVYSQLKGILEFSKIETGQVKADPEDVNIASIIKDAVAVIDPHKNNKITCYFGNVTDPVVTDKQMTYRILVNLLDNANKNTNGGRISVSARKSENYLFIRVSDNGSGFDIRQLPYLYKPFNQGTGDKKKQGVGLGLSLIRSYVKLMRGNIRVKSQIKRGSSFIIRLPIS